MRTGSGENIVLIGMPTAVLRALGEAPGEEARQ